MSRANKFHHRLRLKRKRRFHWVRDLRGDAVALGRVVDTPTPCSCWMCGNTRQHHGVTLQERRAQLGDNEWRDAVDWPRHSISI